MARMRSYQHNRVLFNGIRIGLPFNEFLINHGFDNWESVATADHAGMNWGEFNKQLRIVLDRKNVKRLAVQEKTKWLSA